MRTNYGESCAGWVAAALSADHRPNAALAAKTASAENPDSKA